MYCRKCKKDQEFQRIGGRNFCSVCGHEYGVNELTENKGKWCYECELTTASASNDKSRCSICARPYENTDVKDNPEQVVGMQVKRYCPKCNTFDLSLASLKSNCKACFTPYEYKAWDDMKREMVKEDNQPVVDVGKDAADSTAYAILHLPPAKDTAPKSALDTQVGGSHYKDFPIQPTEFIQKNGLSFLQGCVIKRMCRYNLKGTPLEDLEKAKHEIDMLIELENLKEVE